jgi:hypothetical protein
MNTKNHAEYWKPYLSQYTLEKDYWFVCDSTNRNAEVTMYSPHLNYKYNLSNTEQKMINPITWALSRKSAFDDGIKRNTPVSIAIALGFVEKHSRCRYLLEKFLMTESCNKFSREEVWEIIEDVWCNVDYNCSSESRTREWRDVFSVLRRPEGIVSHLPEKMTLYRGGHRFGFSWTRDLETAKQFQNRTAMLFNDVELLSATFVKDEILFEGSREDEIVVCPESLQRKIALQQIEVLDIKNVTVPHE